MLAMYNDHGSQVNVNTIRFTPNGTRFFTGDSGGDIRIWEDASTMEYAVETKDEDTPTTTTTTTTGATSGSSTARASHYRRGSVAGEEKRMAAAAAAGDTDSEKTSTVAWNARFRCYRTIRHDSLRGDAINCLSWVPKPPDRLIAYSRNNALYMFSLFRLPPSHLPAQSSFMFLTLYQTQTIGMSYENNMQGQNVVIVPFDVMYHHVVIGW
jgi:WD40 repeat protein